MNLHQTDHIVVSQIFDVQQQQIFEFCLFLGWHDVLCKAKEYARWYVDDKLAPIWKKTTDFVDDKLKPIWKKTTDFVDEKLKPIWEKVTDTVTDLVTKIGNKAKNLFSSTLEKTFKIQKLKDDFNECKQRAEAAIKEIDDAKDTIVKIFEDQMDRLKKGELDCVIEALKTVVDESGETFKKIEKATGCIAEKFGYKAYSLSVGLSKGWYCLLSLES